ncbi:MAG: hypothetical protein ACRCU5_13995 [Rhizobiaceae bacterium]
MSARADAAMPAGEVPVPPNSPAGLWIDMAPCRSAGAMFETVELLNDLKIPMTAKAIACIARALAKEGLM